MNSENFNIKFDVKLLFSFVYVKISAFVAWAIINYILYIYLYSLKQNSTIQHFFFFFKKSSNTSWQSAGNDVKH